MLLKDYEAKYGKVKASFQGYLDYMNDPSSTIPKENTDVIEINGKKAVRRQSKKERTNRSFNIAYRLGKRELQLFEAPLKFILLVYE